MRRVAACELPLNTASFCVTVSQRIHVSSPGHVAVSNSGVLGMMLTRVDEAVERVAQRARACRATATAVVAIEPGELVTSGAGSTATVIAQRAACSGGRTSPRRR